MVKSVTSSVKHTVVHDCSAISQASSTKSRNIIARAAATPSDTKKVLLLGVTGTTGRYALLVGSGSVLANVDKPSQASDMLGMASLAVSKHGFWTCQNVIS